MFSVLMAIEGVMAERNPGGIVRSEPIPEGVTLFHALRSSFNIVLSSVDHNQDGIDRWLTLQGIRPGDYGRLLFNSSVADDPLEVRKRHVMSTRAMSFDLRYVIDDDPRLAIFCVDRGISPMCCPHPIYSRSSFLPDSKTGGMAWEEIEAHVRAQHERRAGDRRTEVDDTVEELRYR